MSKKTATALVIPVLFGGALCLGTGTAHADRVRPIAPVEDTGPASSILNVTDIDIPVYVPILLVAGN